MKIWILSLTALFFFAACNSSSTEESAQSANNSVVDSSAIKPMAGSDRDKHNCIASAGYSWSELKHNCVKIFEEGVRLNPAVNNNDQAVISAFIIQPSNTDSIELFLPNENDGQGIVIKPLNEQKNVWLIGNYIITKSNNKFKISIPKIDAHSCATKDLRNPNFIQSLLANTTTLYSQD